jgi:8-oxo-dGTP pyrophosphatase MutT (NUDIX family)
MGVLYQLSYIGNAVTYPLITPKSYCIFRPFSIVEGLLTYSHINDIILKNSLMKNENRKSIRAWAGYALITFKDKIPYIVLVKNKRGIWGLVGGAVEDGEKMIIGGIREVREESKERIMARTSKKLWIGTGLYPNQHDVIYALFSHYVPYFEHRMIEDEEIIEARTFPLHYVLNHMIEHWDDIKYKDKLLLQKVRDKLVLFFICFVEFADPPIRLPACLG